MERIFRVSLSGTFSLFSESCLTFVVHVHVFVMHCSVFKKKYFCNFMKLHAFYILHVYDRMDIISLHCLPQP